jgi:hypothetical protein
MNVNGCRKHTILPHKSHRILELKSAREMGLGTLVRKALRRREQARKAVEDHESTHITVTAAASSVA